MPLRVIFCIGTVKFVFIAGVPPVSMRAQCAVNRYFPDPLGIVSASKTLGFEHVSLPGGTQEE